MNILNFWTVEFWMPDVWSQPGKRLQNLSLGDETTWTILGYCSVVHALRMHILRPQLLLSWASETFAGKEKLGGHGPPSDAQDTQGYLPATGLEL